MGDWEIWKTNLTFSKQTWEKDAHGCDLAPFFEMKIFLKKKLNIEIGSCNIITFKNKKCLNCGKEGHIKSNCPQINNQMKCTKCGEFGHFFGQHDLYCAVCDEQFYHNTEGQLISEYLLDNL